MAAYEKVHAWLTEEHVQKKRVDNECTFYRWLFVGPSKKVQSDAPVKQSLLSKRAQRAASYWPFLWLQRKRIFSTPLSPNAKISG